MQTTSYKACNGTPPSKQEHDKTETRRKRERELKRQRSNMPEIEQPKGVLRARGIASITAEPQRVLRSASLNTKGTLERMVTTILANRMLLKDWMKERPYRRRRGKQGARRQGR